MPERDYSHRSLSDKLGLAPGQRIAALNVRNSDFLDLLSDVAGAKPDGSLRGAYDRIFLQIDTARDLPAIAGVPPHLRPGGALWILHPKGKKAAYDETHTATRCVIPLAKRRVSAVQRSGLR